MSSPAAARRVRPDPANATLWRLWRLADPNPARLLLALLLATLSLACGVGLLAVSAWLISRAAQQPPILILQVAIVSVRAFGIGRGVLRYAERLAGHDAALRSLTRIRLAVYERLERLSPAGLGRYRRGDLLARLVEDVDSSLDLIVRAVLPALSGLLAALLAVTIGAAILPAGGMALLAMVAMVGLFSPWLAGRVGARAQDARAAAHGRLTEQVVTSLDTAPELLAYGSLDAAVADIAAADAELTDIDRRSAGAAGAAGALNVVATGVTIVVMLVFGVNAVRSGALDGVWLATLALLPLAVADVLSGMPAAALASARVAGAARRIFEVIDAPDPVPDRGQDRANSLADRPAAGSTTGAQPAPETGNRSELVLSALSARYPETERPAVTGIELDLPPGRRVALVGPSGSGKSTLAAVLLRLLDHERGCYTVGARDVRDLPETQVRSVLTAMDQRVHLFDTTIEQNVRLANRTASPEQLWAAVRRAQLDTWIDSLPEGLATRVGAHGSAVSGGQAQRIGLARVLLAGSPMVVLDEPGEHLDTAMADEVTAAALVGTEGRSVLLITHRMAQTESCDEVLVLAEGRIVQRGTPSDLRSRSGWYATALARQDSHFPTAKEPTDE